MPRDPKSPTLTVAAGVTSHAESGLAVGAASVVVQPGIDLARSVCHRNRARYTGAAGFRSLGSACPHARCRAGATGDSGRRTSHPFYACFETAAVNLAGYALGRHGGSAETGIGLASETHLAASLPGSYTPMGTMHKELTDDDRRLWELEV